MKRFFKVIKNLITSTINNDYPGLASEMAYNFIMSMFPFAIFAVAVFGLLGDPTVIDQIINLLRAFAPTDTLNLIKDVLDQIFDTASTGILSILGLFGSLWAASRGIISIVKGINRAYEVQETRSFFKINAIAILTVIILALVLFFSVNLTIFGAIILKFISKFLPVSNDISTVVLFVRWPVTFLGLFVMILIIYYFLPNIKAHKTKLLISSIYGSLFFSIFWLIGSWLFSLYVENFARYNAIYGTLGAFVILLVWLYYSSLIILLGGEISSEVYKTLNPKTIKVKSN